MKIILKSIVVLLGIFLLTGCTVKRELGYKGEHINGSYLNNLKKVNKKISIKNNNYKMDYKKWGYAIVMSSDFNQKILKGFMNQYFSKVEISSDKNSFIEIDSKVNKFSQILHQFPVYITLDIENTIIVKKEGKVILNKTYKETVNTPKMIIDAFLSQDEIYSKLYSNAMLDFYEIYFKPDLLKALEENI